MSKAVPAASLEPVVFHSARHLANYMEILHRNLDVSLHRVTNITIDEFTQTSARTTSYIDALLVRRSAAGDPIYHVAGRYEDALIAGPQGWRILRRRYMGLISEGNVKCLEAVSPADCGPA